MAHSRISDDRQRPTSGIPFLPAGSKGRALLPFWRQEIRESSLRDSTSTPQGMGLIGKVVSKAAFRDLPGSGGQNQRFYLAPAEAAPLNHNAYARWKDLKTSYEAQQRGLQTFTQAVLDSLDPAIKSEISDVGTGTMNLTLRQILKRVDAYMGTLTNADLDEQYDRLRIPYVPGEDITAITTVHNDVHRLLADNGQALPEMVKIREYATALSGVHTFVLAHKEFIKTVSLKKQTYKALAQRMAAAADADKSSTSATAGYANSVTVTEKQVEQMVLAAVAKAQPAADPKRKKRQTDTRQADNKQSNGNRGPEDERDRRKPKKLRKQQSLYCWTHGVCGHSGQECWYPTENHVDEATATDRRNGSSKGIASF